MSFGVLRSKDFLPGSVASATVRRSSRPPREMTRTGIPGRLSDDRSAYDLDDPINTEARPWSLRI